MTSLAELPQLVKRKTLIEAPLVVHEILVVEDDEDIRPFVERVLHRLAPEARVIWVRSARIAMAEIDRILKSPDRTLDLILADLLLPGDELGIRLWHAFGKRIPDTPFAFMSSLDSSRYFRLFNPSDSPPPFLPKPLKISDFGSTLDYLLNGKGWDFTGS